jgi:carbon-monoxide dehydrogenase medium subunit
MLEIVGPEGMRRAPLGELIRGPGTVDLRSGEILTAIEFGCLSERSATAFLKEGRRKAMEISVVCVAAFLALDADGICTAVRIAVGAAAPRAFRAMEAEKALLGKRARFECFAEAGRLAAEAVSPISDVRASAERRRYLTTVMVERTLAACHDRILDAPR